MSVVWGSYSICMLEEFFSKGKAALGVWFSCLLGRKCLVSRTYIKKPDVIVHPIPVGKVETAVWDLLPGQCSLFDEFRASERLSPKKEKNERVDSAWGWQLSFILVLHIQALTWTQTHTPEQNVRISLVIWKSVGWLNWEPLTTGKMVRKNGKTKNTGPEDRKETQQKG